MKHAVVGFEFTGDPLLEGGFIPFDDGLTVIYGLNGAGKTRLVEGMRAALTGVRSNVGLSLLVRLHKPTERDLQLDSVRGLRTPGTGLLLAIADEFSQPQDYFLDEPLELEVADGIVDRFIRESFADTRPTAWGIDVPQELVEEVAADRLFLMHPAGSARLPSWDVWPVADLAGKWVAGNVDRLIRASDDLDEDDMDPFHEVYWGTPIRAGAAESLVTRTDDGLAPTSVAAYSGQVSPFQRMLGFSMSGSIDFGLDVLSPSDDPDSDTIAYIGEIVTVAADAESWQWLRDSSKQLTAGDALSSGRRVADSLNSLDWAIRQRSDDDDAEPDEGMSKNFETADLLAREIATELEMRAAASFQMMLLDSPTPQLALTPTIMRFSRPAAQWSFRRATSRRYIGLEGLSRAERIWAVEAISDALYWHRRDHTARQGDELRHIVSFLDEPEVGLHRSAEAHTARALVEKAKDPRRVVIAATHSPELLDAADARVLEVKRDGGQDGSSVVRELDLHDRTALEDLGLMPSDLLRWPRVFLLVEGAHDEALLDAYFGGRLRAARVQVLPLRGASKLPGTIESRVLFDFTEAHVVALVDNQLPLAISEAWTQALAARQTGTLEAATSTLADSIDGQEEEARFLREWLTSALRHGRETRVTPYSLRAKDIIEYVPVESLVPTHASWDTLRSEHADDLAAKSGMPRDFKKWLERRYKVLVTPDLLRSAARDASRAPVELEQLMKFLEASAQR